MGLLCQRAAGEPAAAGISLQPFLQQTGDRLGPACPSRCGPGRACLLGLAAETPQILPEDVARELLLYLLYPEMQLLGWQDPCKQRLLSSLLLGPPLACIPTVCQGGPLGDAVN